MQSIPFNFLNIDVQYSMRKNSPSLIQLSPFIPASAYFTNVEYLFAVIIENRLYFFGLSSTQNNAKVHETYNSTYRLVSTVPLKMIHLKTRCLKPMVALQESSRCPLPSLYTLHAAVSLSALHLLAVPSSPPPPHPPFRDLLPVYRHIGILRLGYGSRWSMIEQPCMGAFRF